MGNGTESSIETFLDFYMQRKKGHWFGEKAAQGSEGYYGAEGSRHLTMLFMWMAYQCLRMQLR